MADRGGFVSAEEILIRELDKAVDHEVLQTDPKQVNRWRAIPYKSEEFAGVMLGEGGGADQQPIAIRLEAKGMYRVYLGLYGGFNAQQLHVKLSDDPSSEKIPIQVTGNRTLVISETFWKEADLTGKTLILAGSGDDKRPGALAYVRLVSVNKKASSEEFVGEFRLR